MNFPQRIAMTDIKSFHKSHYELLLIEGVVIDHFESPLNNEK